MIEKSMLDRIMGEGTVTSRLVAMRRTPVPGEELVTGVWYSNFTRVKEDAEKRGIPFFAMWTNGDLCGFCKRFTENILTSQFIERMQTSGGLWWLGGSMDDNEEDRRNGKGFRWCLGPDSKVNYFPFFAVTQTDTEGNRARGFFGSGHDYDGRKKAPEGTKLIFRQLGKILSSEYGTVKSILEDPEVADIIKAKPSTAKPAQAATSQIKTNTSLHIRFNPSWDAEHIARFQSSIAANGGHCICQKGNSPDTMCMCKSFLEQDKPGPCHCGAFEKFEA